MANSAGEGSDMKGKVKRVVLAYSGGLDTSIILKWLQETYGCEVVTFTADLGQGEELGPAGDKALMLGIKPEHIFIEDLREEFTRDFVFPMFRANALDEGIYLLGTSIARPLISKAQIDIARKVGADAVCHGATGKGNDQVRFELSYYALEPSIKIIAPWREWDFKSREDLIAFTNGVTGGVESSSSAFGLRAAPSAGALYAGEVYVVAERVQGLAEGVYYYAVEQHELVALRSGSWLREVGRAVTEPGAIEGAAAAILLTNVFERYSWRYANRGYRYALIDSGHIGENLRLAARSAGLGWTREWRFEDDGLNELLQVNGREEAVCAVHAVGPVVAAAPTFRTVRPLLEKLEVAPEKLPRSGPLPTRFHEATKLVPAPSREERELPPISERPAMGPEVALPMLSPRPEASVEKAVQERRSAKFFRKRPVRLEELAFALEMAQGPAAFERSMGVELFLPLTASRGSRPASTSTGRGNGESPRYGVEIFAPTWSAHACARRRRGRRRSPSSWSGGSPKRARGGAGEATGSS